MRAFATFATVLLTGVCLSSCDMPGQQQTAAVTPPAPPACNCGAQATMTPPTAPTEHLTRLSYGTRHHYVRHPYYGNAGYRASHYRGGYTTDYSQQSADTYDYVSSSSVTRSESSYSDSGYSSGYGYGARIAWVDGYGRGYFNNGPVTVAATMRGRRLDPYHGYDADCPEDQRR